MFNHLKTFFFYATTRYSATTHRGRRHHGCGRSHHFFGNCAGDKNPTPEERLRYGSINEKNKLLVNKVRDYNIAQPALRSPDVNWTEFESDYQDRVFFETRVNRLLALVEGLTNAKILHDYDNYQNALTDYAYTQYKKDTEAGGYVTKYNELRQFFPNTGGGSNGNGGTGTGTEPPQ